MGSRRYLLIFEWRGEFMSFLGIIKLPDFQTRWLSLFVLVLELSTGNPIQAATSEPAEVLIARCEQGQGVACFEIGEKNTFGLGKPIDEPRGLLFYEKGCELGHLRACARAAFGHYNARGTSTADLAKSLSYGAKSCDGDDELGCEQLAQVYRRATGLPNYIQRATELSAKACRLGAVSACGDTSTASSTISSSASIVAARLKRNACLRESKSEADLAHCWAQPGLTADEAPIPRENLRAERNSEALAACRTQSLTFDQTVACWRAAYQQGESGTSQDRSNSLGSATFGNQSSSSSGRVVCTSTTSRNFTYTNSFAGTVSRLDQYKRSYASLQESFGFRTGNGVHGTGNTNETANMDCTWHANEVAAETFVQRAISDARAQQKSTARSYFSTTER